MAFTFDPMVAMNFSFNSPSYNIDNRRQSIDPVLRVEQYLMDEELANLLHQDINGSFLHREFNGHLLQPEIEPEMEGAVGGIPAPQDRVQVLVNNFEQPIAPVEIGLTEGLSLPQPRNLSKIPIATKSKVPRRVSCQVASLAVVNEEVEECSICISPLKPIDCTKRLKCKHMFHVNCISGWLKNAPGKGCPICRRAV